MKIFVDNTERFDALEETLNLFNITPAGNKTVIKMALPIVDIHGVWHCNMSEFQLRLPWKVEYTSAFNRGMPFLAFFNRACLLPQVIIVITLRKRSCPCNYVL